MIQTGLRIPWDLTFLPDGRMLVSEREGNLIMFASAAPGAGRLATVAVPGVHAEGDAGLMSIALDPAFASNGFLYACVSRDDVEDGSPVWRNQLVRFVITESNILMNAVLNRFDMFAAPLGDGCRVRVGPDRKLWMTMGDADLGELVSQDPAYLSGKTLRFNLDGSTPADNPVFPGTAGPSPVYTIGHRNPQGLGFSPATGTPYVAEHAHRRVTPTTEEHDAIYLIRPGANFGYPEVAGPGSRFDQPAWSGGARRNAPGSLEFLAGPEWGDWSGDAVVACLAGQDLLHFRVAGAGLSELAPLGNTYGRLRSAVLGPDHALYVTTSNWEPSAGATDVIVKIQPESQPAPEVATGRVAEPGLRA